MKLRKWAYLSVLAFVSITAHSQETPSDKYCLYLAKRSANDIVTSSFYPARDIKRMSEEFNATIEAMDEIRPIRDAAIQKHLSFEEFRTEAAKKHVQVAASYEPEYLMNYQRQRCGTWNKMVVIGRDENGKLVEKSRKVTFTKQFNPTQEPYYKQSLIGSLE